VNCWCVWRDPVLYQSGDSRPTTVLNVDSPALQNGNGLGRRHARAIRGRIAMRPYANERGRRGSETPPYRTALGRRHASTWLPSTALRAGRASAPALRSGLDVPASGGGESGAEAPHSKGWPMAASLPIQRSVGTAHRPPPQRGYGDASRHPPTPPEAGKPGRAQGRGG
jgi:hypothetical protein